MKERFNTADFAYWTIEEYARPDGTKPEMDPARAEYVRLFCSLADLFVKQMGDGEVLTEIDPDTEHLILTFSSDGIGSGRLEVEHVFKE